MGVSRVFCACLLLFVLIVDVEPFLYNSGKEILSSLFSSSSSDSNPNIEDLRVRGHVDHLNKLEEDEEESMKKSEAEEKMKNEATPGFIQKKIGKIITKLQLFTALRDTISNRPKPESPEEDNISAENDISKNLNLLVSNNSTEPTTHVYKVNKFTPPQSPERITLYPAEDRSGATDGQISATTPTSDDGTKLSLSPGNIGVYFMELLGGLATLIYGAAIQVSSIGSSTPPPNKV